MRAVNATDISRRRFLQGTLAGAGAAALLPSWLADLAEGATPIGPHDGVLVLVLLGGGNDGLNTVIPIADAGYAARRGNIAVKASDALPLVRGVALHPKLTWLKGKFDAGQVAVVQGVGDTGNDLSHFTSMARWQAGDGTQGSNGGWAGRWLDGLGGGTFDGVAIGSSAPLAVTGKKVRALTLPPQFDAVIDPGSKDDYVRRSADCVRAMADGATARWPWADALALAGRTAVDVTGSAKQLYTPKLTTGQLAQQLDLCARIVNADVGARVLHASLGTFDHHANLPGDHARMLGFLDDGLRAFFDGLAADKRSRVTVVTYSEFGRRVQSNQSNGTDHGTASVLFAIGERVKGGLYGAMPSLTSLDKAGNLVPAVDFRSVYATLLDTWLRADSRELLGSSYENLGFVSSP